MPTPCFGVKPQAQCGPVPGSWRQSLKLSSGHLEGGLALRPEVEGGTGRPFCSSPFQAFLFLKWWLANIFWLKMT